MACGWLAVVALLRLLRRLQIGFGLPYVGDIAVGNHLDSGQGGEICEQLDTQGVEVVILAACRPYDGTDRNPLGEYRRITGGYDGVCLLYTSDAADE